MIIIKTLTAKTSLFIFAPFEVVSSTQRQKRLLFSTPLQSFRFVSYASCLKSSVCRHIRNGELLLVIH
ncbi:hypothetical protein GQ457_06G042490 [Hibiscus cannabinus]